MELDLLKDIQKKVETSLAKLILKGDVIEGSTVNVTIVEDDLSFKVIK